MLRSYGEILRLGKWVKNEGESESLARSSLLLTLCITLLFAKLYRFLLYEEAYT